MEVSDVPPALRERLGEDATVSLLELFDTARQEWVPDVTTAAIERFEHRLGDEIGAFRTELGKQIGEVRAEMGELRTEMGELRTELRAEMGELRTDLRTEMGELRTALRTEMGELRTELRAEMRELRTAMVALRGELREELATVRLDVANLRLGDATARFELLKWSFVFWVGQLFAVAGVMALVLRLSRG